MGYSQPTKEKRPSLLGQKKTLSVSVSSFLAWTFAFLNVGDVRSSEDRTPLGTGVVGIERRVARKALLCSEGEDLRRLFLCVAGGSHGH